MGRTYIIAMLVMGVFGTMLNNCGSSQVSTGTFQSSATTSSSSSAAALESEAAGSDSDPADPGTIELDRSYDGHFYADVEINSQPVRMLVDTGATGIALTVDDARRAGIAVSIGLNDVVGRGAGGDVKGEVVEVDRVTLGHKTAEGMAAVVVNGGDQSLLGQEFLSKFSSVEIRGDKMVLR